MIDRPIPHCAARASLAALAGIVLFAASLPSPASAQDKPARAQIERGRYLVTTSGCHDCHTPMKMGASGPEPDMSRMLSGHPDALTLPPAPRLPEGPWLVVSSATNTAFAGPWGVSYSANLTPDAMTGLGQWSLKDFKGTIRSGRHLGRGREVLPPMPIPAYKHFNDADLGAIFAYLRSIPPVTNRVPEPMAPMAAK
ncbi:MAG: diheme cytochrome c-553 [Burkholderiaceae bacterium]|nr:diheme cytochrome c-553 [Burkholderiaceae bacterium]